MQRDFHYYCIGVLAKAAGFNSKDALTIAYASQYVDDATERTQIPVKAPNDIRIDPVRTAHKGAKWLLGAKWHEQKEVYLPFHFIPNIPYEPPGWTFEYITKPGSGFALELLHEAFKGERECECWDPTITDFELFRLCRIGIALHTFADTWAHQGFSGRSNDENEVSNIEYITKIRWEDIRPTDRPSKVWPRIGHAEAGKLPDKTFFDWKYTNKANWQQHLHKRNNTELFHKAAKAIYDELSKAKKPRPDSPKIPWKKIEGKIFEQLKTRGKGLEDRCKKWRENFIDIFDDLDDPNEFKYDDKDWRKTALEASKEKYYDWEKYSKKDRRWNKFTLKNDYFFSPFYHFHRAALLQRDFVLERLP